MYTAKEIFSKTLNIKLRLYSKLGSNSVEEDNPVS